MVQGRVPPSSHLPLLRQMATSAGARIVSGVRVEALGHAIGHVNGVYVSDGRFVRASAVVLAIAPRDALKVVGTASPALQEALGEPRSGACGVPRRRLAALTQLAARGCPGHRCAALLFNAVAV